MAFWRKASAKFSQRVQRLAISFLYAAGFYGDDF